VADRAEGTRRVYYIDPNGLGALRKWLDQFWDQALAAFQAEIAHTAAPPPAPQSKGKPHESHDHGRARPQKRARRRRTRPRF
jgi:hypothetical protein